MCFVPIPVMIPVAVSPPSLPPSVPPSAIGEKATTLLIKHLREGLTGELLAQFLNDEGFAGCFDFIYVPRNLQTKRASGFAFVNFTCYDFAARALPLLHARRQLDLVAADKGALEACWSEASQGLEAQVAKYRNSPLMHESVPEEFKPMVFQDGVRQPFPAPTEEISLPATRFGAKVRGRARRGKDAA
jgi:RNA recognition motif-containing protein